jgi:hypothetical protein
LVANQEDLVAVPATATATAAMSAASATAIPAAAATSTTSATLDLGSGFVDVERASPNLSAVECRDGFIALFGVAHFHKAEAARAAGVAVRHDADAVHLPMGFEKFAQFIFPGIEVEVANENIFHGIASC